MDGYRDEKAGERGGGMDFEAATEEFAVAHVRQSKGASGKKMPDQPGHDPQTTRTDHSPEVCTVVGWATTTKEAHDVRSPADLPEQ
jgi:hypothetical protein